MPGGQRPQSERDCRLQTLPGPRRCCHASRRDRPLRGVRRLPPRCASASVMCAAAGWQDPLHHRGRERVATSHQLSSRCCFRHSVKTTSRPDRMACAESTQRPAACGGVSPPRRPPCPSAWNRRRPRGGPRLPEPGLPRGRPPGCSHLGPDNDPLAVSLLRTNPPVGHSSSRPFQGRRRLPGHEAGKASQLEPHSTQRDVVLEQLPKGGCCSGDSGSRRAGGGGGRVVLTVWYDGNALLQIHHFTDT